MFHSLFWQLSFIFVIVHGKIQFSIPEPCFVNEPIQVKWTRAANDPVHFFIQKENPTLETADIHDIRLGEDGKPATDGITQFTFRGAGPHRLQAVDPRDTSKVLSTSQVFNVRAAPEVATSLSISLSLPFTTSTSAPATPNIVSAAPPSSTSIKTPNSTPIRNLDASSSVLPPAAMPGAASKQSDKSQAAIIIGILTPLFVIFLLVGLGLYLRRRRRRLTAGRFNRDMMVRSTINTPITPVVGKPYGFGSPHSASGGMPSPVYKLERGMSPVYKVDEERRWRTEQQQQQQQQHERGQMQHKVELSFGTSENLLDNTSVDSHVYRL